MYVVTIDGKPHCTTYATIEQAARARTGIVEQVVQKESPSFIPGDTTYERFGALHQVDIARADKTPLDDADVDAIVRELSKRRP